jgi:DnaJ-class molecular chaperone
VEHFNTVALSVRGCVEFAEQTEFIVVVNHPTGGFMKKKCDRCNGQGWTTEHAPMYMHDEDGSCNGNCPVQVQCEYCQGTGEVEEL